MAARWTAFVIWAAVAATALGWVLRVSASPRAMPLYTVTVSTAAAARGDIARVLGTDAPVAGAVAAAPAPDRKLQLVGVIATRGGGPGLALIALDGKPARAYQVGAKVDGELVLQSVGARSAAVGPPGGAVVSALELPPLAAPATGVPGAAGAATRPPLTGPGGQVRPVGSVPMMAPSPESTQPGEGGNPAPAPQPNPQSPGAALR